MSSRSQTDASALPMPVSSKRVACIGNMNNNFFALVRHLRDRGVDADLLLLDDELDHFHPSADTYDESYREYTHAVAWGNVNHFGRVPADDVSKSVAAYDILVACGSAPAFLWKAGHRVDAFVPYGTDFMQYPFMRITRPGRFLNWLRFSRAQRAAICDASLFVFAPTNAKMETIVRKLGRPGRRLNIAIPLVYPAASDDASAHARESSELIRFVRELRSRTDILIVNHNRHAWAHPQPLGWSKGTDVLLKGMAAFIHERRDVRTTMLTFEYGFDVAATKQLAEDLGIAPNIVWRPVTSRKELLAAMRLADFGVGELAYSFLTYGTAYEVLAARLPLLARRDDHLYRESYQELYPMVNVTTSADITAALHGFVAEPERYRAIGAAGRRWLDHYAIDDVMTTLLEQLGLSSRVATAEVAY